MSIKDRLRARLSIAKGDILKLADGEGDAAPAAGKFATVQAAAKKAEEALAALEGVTGVDEGMDATAAALAAMKECEDAISALGGGSAPASEPAPEAMADKPAEEQQQMSARKEAELVALRKQVAQIEHEKEVARLAGEAEERRSIEERLGKRMIPAAVKQLGSMSLVDLRKFAETIEGAPAGVSLSGPQPPRSSAPVTAPGGVEISEYEVARVKAYADKYKGPGARPADEVLSRYVEHKTQQLRGAKGHEATKRLGRRVEGGHVLLSVDGRVVTLATTPVTPIEEFGASSPASHAASHGGHTGSDEVRPHGRGRTRNLRRLPQTDGMDGCPAHF